MASTWGRRARQFGRRARQAGQHMQRVASQAPEAARKAGRALARHVVSIQRSAGLETSRGGPKLMMRSYESAVGVHQGAGPSPHWQHGYAEQATEMIPALRVARDEALAQEAARFDVRPPEPPAARPTWPFGPAGPQPEDPEAGS
jgi:hypothetical protein